MSGDCPGAPQSTIEELGGTLSGIFAEAGIAAPSPTPTPLQFLKEADEYVAKEGATLVDGTPLRRVPWAGEPTRPTCGFYALEMLTRYWNQRAGTKAVSGGEMLDQARMRGYTVDGRVSIENLASTVREYGYTANTSSGGGIKDLEAALERGIPPIVLFCVDEGPGGPQASDPGRGHFAVIEAVYSDDRGEKWVVARHSWRDQTFVWPAKKFEASWARRDHEMLLVEPGAS